MRYNTLLPTDDLLFCVDAPQEDIVISIPSSAKSSTKEVPKPHVMTTADRKSAVPLETPRSGQFQLTERIPSLKP